MHRVDAMHQGVFNAVEYVSAMELASVSMYNASECLQCIRVSAMELSCRIFRLGFSRGAASQLFTQEKSCSIVLQILANTCTEILAILCSAQSTHSWHILLSDQFIHCVQSNQNIWDVSRQSCKMSNFLHRSIISKWIYPKKKRVNRNEFST